MLLQRKPKWERTLAGRIASARELTFAWGSFDCAMWVSDWIRDATGVDPAASYRGKYSTEAEAEAIFGQDLGAFAATIASAIGAAEVHPNYARRGDVVFLDNSTPGNPSAYGALGLVDLDARFAICVSQQGVVRVHRKRWKRAWQIG